ncbi:hypothetical protein [Arcanobacterium bovis]|uniref:Uncharacterized protein n=1 Tax=Arcanobacterium bovis TaxID=2529275 RepID=A0A4Q9V2P4_9ACTO|nr:hypothetical protein [Arcanobacterium bovis]TBW23906.1 hypothetical protein EZJ44_01940 [Arcanobacterium bovis]
MKTLKEKITDLSTKTKIIIIAGIGITLTLSGILINWQTNRAEYDKAFDAYSAAHKDNKSLMEAATRQQEECKANALPGKDDCQSLSLVMEKVKKLSVVDDGASLDDVKSSTTALTVLNTELKETTSAAHENVVSSSNLWRSDNLKPELQWSHEAVTRSRNLISESDGKVSDPGLRNNLAAKTDALEKIVKEVEAKIDQLLVVEAKDQYAALYQARAELIAAEEALKNALQQTINQQQAAQQQASQPAASKSSAPSKSSTPARKAGSTKTGGTTSTGSGKSSGGTTAPSTPPATGGGTSTSGSSGGQNGWVETGSEDLCSRTDSNGNSWNVPC